MKRLLLILVLLVQTAAVLGQNFPVRVTPQAIPPYPTNISGYANGTLINSPLRVQLVLSDVTASSREVRLAISIEGSNINATSAPVVIGAPTIILDGGIPVDLTIAELAPYFELQNLQGISSVQYDSSLPDGTYRFCFEVFDAFNGNTLSAKSCATIFLINNDPPFLNKPDNQSTLTEQNPTNIIFQWTPRHVNVPNVSYEFSLVEVWDRFIDPQAIFLASPPLYQEVTTSTTLLYGPVQPLLLPGKRYAWRVRAFSTNNGEEVSVFNNNGNSEIFWFDYQGNCEAPTNVEVKDVTLTNATISWFSHPDHLDYTVFYRESGSDRWYQKNTPRDYVTIDEFKPDTVYDYKVVGNCTDNSFGESPIDSFRTQSEEIAEYTACGLEPDPVDLSNQELLTELFENDVFKAGDFPVYVKEASGSSSFTGEGYISTPWLATVRIPVKFENIKINTDMQLVDGFVVTTYDPTWGNIIDADEIIEIVTGDDGDVDVINVDVDIVDVEVNDDGTITIITSDGQEINQPGGEDVVYVDNTGETWSVSEDGTVTQGEQAEGGPANAGNTNGVGSGGVNEITSKDVKIEFSKGNGYYAFDQFPQNAGGNIANKYDKSPISGGGEYYPPYKAVSNLEGHTSDIVIADATFINSDYTKDDIIFKTKEGTKIQANWNGNKATLSISKAFDFGKQQIIAAIKPKDTTKKHEVAGYANLWHLASQDVTDISVTIIPVNNVSISNSIGDQINEIYNPAGVNFNVNIGNRLTIEPGTWDLNRNGSLDIGDSDLLEQYTNEQRAIKDYFGANVTNYNDKTYYIFVTDLPTTDSGTDGFMPLKRQYGFIFGQNNIARTIAHELGHGVFGLKHPFTQYNTEKGATDFLMDYGSGVAFSHMDWEKMHAPGIQIYWFQGDEAGENRANDGIDLLGNIITVIEFDKNKYDVVGLINSQYPYLRSGYKVSSKDSEELLGIYRAKIEANKVKYISDDGKEIPYNINTTNKGLAKIKVSRDDCTYNVTEIQWEKESFTSINDVVNKVTNEIKKQNPKWRLYSYNNADPSCNAANTLADIIENDASSPCANSETIQQGFDKIKIVFDNQSSTEEQIVNAINSNCLSSLRLFTDEEIIVIFRKLAISEPIKDSKEIAILRLMTVIDSSNYPTFFNVLKENNNKIYINLLHRVEDASFYWFGKDNLKNFLEVLLFMHTNSNTIDVRVDLINLLMQFKKSDITAKSSDILAEGNLDIVFNKSIKEEEKEFYYNALKKNNFELFKEAHEAIDVTVYSDELWNNLYNTLVTLLSEKGDANDTIYLFENIDFDNPIYPPGNNSYGVLLKTYLFTKFPNDKRTFYTYLKENDFEKILNFIQTTSKYSPSDKVEDLVTRTVEGFSKLIDEVGDITDKIILVNWFVNNPDALPSFNDSFGALLTSILSNISSSEDKDFVYKQLSANNHDLFVKCIDILSGSSDYLFKFSETYSKLISEANSGKVQDRIDIIEKAISEGDDWSWFWYSDTEDVISAMFSHMSSSQAREFINYFKDDNYKLFFQIWDVLKNQTWWPAIDGDNKRFENFVTSLGKNFILAGELAQDQFPDNLTQYKDESQNYLNSKADDILEIEGNYAPMTRATYFDGTGGKNDYNLEATISGKQINVKINIEDTDGKDKIIIDKKFSPFEYIFIELLEDVKVNETLTYNKGDILAIPSFYLAWMDGYIDSDQLSTVFRVGVDAVVVVASAAAAVGTGGASLALLGAEIFFATTDAVIALKGDEMKQIFGDDFVNGLETANILWGIANLPSAIANLPKGLAKIKTSAGNILESGTDAFKTFVSNAKDLKSLEVTLDLKKFVSALKNLKQADKTAYLNQLKQYADAIAIKYDNLIASGVNPTEKIKDYYYNLKKLIFSLRSNGGTLAFNRISDDILNLIGSEINFLRNSVSYNTSGKYVDIIIHASINEPGKYVLRINDVEEVVEAAKLTERLNEIDPTKTIRLLSCDEGSSAVEISQSLGREIIHSKGEIKIYENGVIEADNWQVANPDGNIDDLTITNPATGSGEYITLYKNYVDALTDAIKADLLSFLGNSRYDEFIEMLTKSRVPSNWTIKKIGETIRFVEQIGGEEKVWAELLKKQNGEIFMKAIGGVGGTGQGNVNHLLNVDPPLMKNFVYEVDNGRFIFETDELGRVKKITDVNVSYDSPSSGRRNEAAQQRAKKVKDGRNPGDDGGHMASAESGGPVEQINYFPQDPDFNQPPGLWREMEMYLKGLKDANPGDTFKFEVVPVFQGNSKRPSEFIVQISKNGIPINVPQEYIAIPNPF